MALSWDYSALADSYDKRPGYPSAALDSLSTSIGLRPGRWVADIGAGTGKLTLPLLRRGYRVVAVEPNSCMRRIGQQKAIDYDLTWTNTTAEQTGLASGAFDLVIFGSSFNVVDQHRARRETARILAPRGWFACLWNHRCLDDPVQARVETLIHDRVPAYQYGSRREDQSRVIAQSRLFHPAKTIETAWSCELSVADYVAAWRSHATLARQSGHQFESIIAAIDELLAGETTVRVPYLTRIWYAQRRS